MNKVYLILILLMSLLLFLMITPIVTIAAQNVYAGLTEQEKRFLAIS